MEVQQVAKDSRDVRSAIEEGLKDALETGGGTGGSIARDEKSAGSKRAGKLGFKKKNDSLTCKIRQIEQKSVILGKST